jgi:hypothetical protein
MRLTKPELINVDLLHIGPLRLTAIFAQGQCDSASVANEVYSLVYRASQSVSDSVFTEAGQCD